jgi:hypothetical protein
LERILFESITGFYLKNISLNINQLQLLFKNSEKKFLKYLSDKKEALPLHPLSGKPVRQHKDL